MNQAVITGFRPDTSAPPEPVQARRGGTIVAAARRRKWVILAAVVLALLAGAIAVVLIKPGYTASSTIEIRREANDVVGVEDARTSAPMIDQEFYQTQYGLLRSHAIAERVAGTLNIASDPRFYELFGDSHAKSWFADGRLTPNAPALDIRLRRAGNILLDNIEVGSERSSRLVKIAFTSRDPAFSRKVANAWGDAFIQDTLARRFNATTAARRFLETRLAQLRRRIDESERQVVDYAERQGIINLPGAPVTSDGIVFSERSLAADDLGSLNRVLGSAVAERIAAQSRLQSPVGQVQEALDNTALSTLRQQREVSNAEYGKLMAQFTPDYPPARALADQIIQYDLAIGREERRITNTLRANYESAARREASLKGRVDQLKGEMLDVRRRSIQYNIYQREVDTSRQLYDALLQRYKAIGVGAGVGVNNISIVDQAALPERPSSPNIPRVIGIMLILGLLVGIAAAWTLEQLNQGVDDPGAVEEEIGLPLLGTIPKTPGMNPALVFDRKSAIAEAYLSLKSALSFTTPHGVPRTLAVTSAGPSEGKSTTSFALALTLAYANLRVVIVDADMRKPSQHKYFDTSNDVGLSNYLSGGADLAGITRTTPRLGLSLITAGPTPPSAPDLLSSSRLDALLADLASQYDVVIVDAPPVMGFADAPIIGSRVEAMLFVVEAHRTRRSEAQTALARLKVVKVHLVGAVLTKFNAKRSGYGYGYGNAYDYGSNKKAA